MKWVVCGALLLSVFSCSKTEMEVTNTNRALPRANAAAVRREAGLLAHVSLENCGGSGLEAGDLDGDGKVDLAILQSDPGGLLIY